jgi:hypothetical protein
MAKPSKPPNISKVESMTKAAKPQTVLSKALGKKGK